MNEQLTPSTAIKPIDEFRNALKKPGVVEQFTSLCGGDKARFEQLKGSILTLIAQDNQLMNCKVRDVISIASEIAALQLPISKTLGKAYIVCYNQSTRMSDGSWQKIPTPQLVIGYKGLIEMAHRSGMLKTLNRGVVHRGELIAHDMLTGRYTFDSASRESDEVIGYFAYLETKTGYAQTIYMTVQEMAQFAKRYSPSVGRNTTVENLIAIAQQPQLGGKGNGWEGNFTAMALKTVERRLLTLSGILSVDARVDYGGGEIIDESTPTTTEFVQAQTIDVDTIDTVQPIAPPGDIADTEAEAGF